jgi:hypothetical protein
MRKKKKIGMRLDETSYSKSPATKRLIGGDLGSWNNVAVEVVVDVCRVTRVRALDVSWDLGGR